MAFVKKTWKDRLVEFAGRRTLTKVSGNVDSALVVDVTRSEGEISQVGDTFSAANMNDLEDRIAAEFQEVSANLGGLSFMRCTQAEYDAMESHEENTVYLIKS